MDCIKRYMFSLCLRQMGAHTHAPSPAFIHYLKHSLVVKLCFLTIKYSSILKVMGLYTMSLSRTSVFAVRCLRMHWFPSRLQFTSGSAVLSQVIKPTKHQVSFAPEHASAGASVVCCGREISFARYMRRCRKSIALGAREGLQVFVATCCRTAQNVSWVPLEAAAINHSY